MNYCDRSIILAAAYLFLAAPANAASPANNVLWLDASQITGLADGATVSTWPDASGHGNTAMASGAPTFRAAVRNGRGVVHLNGSSDLFTVFHSTSINVSSHTLFWVTYFTGATSASVLNKLGLDFTHFCLRYQMDPSAGTSGNLAIGDSGIQAARGGSFGFLNKYAVGAGTFDDTAPVGYTSLRLFADGAEESSYIWNYVSSPPPATPFVNANNLLIGRQPSVTEPRFFQGDIAELILFNTKLSDQEILDVSAYLGQKWGTAMVGGNPAVGFALVSGIGTTLNSAPNPSVTGSNISVSATVSLNGLVMTNATGTMVLKEGAEVLVTAGVTNGIATFGTVQLAAGPHYLTALYSGDSVNPPGSNSVAYYHAVLTAAQQPSVTMLAPSANPILEGSSVTFTARLQTNGMVAADAAGTVVFRDGGATLGASSVSGGQATFATSALAFGAHLITAEYSGSPACGPSLSTTLTQLVQRTTSVVLTSSPNPWLSGKSVTFTTTVQNNGATAGSARGWMIFKDGAIPLATNLVLAGVSTLATTVLTPGTHTITAIYSGDNSYMASTSGPITQVTLATPAAGWLTESQVFQSGTEGYPRFRIPAIVRANSGTLLAFAEGRQNSSGDAGDVDVVLKRSSDNGVTWGPLQVVTDDGVNTVGNSTPVVLASSGKILLITCWNDGSTPESQVLAGTAVRRVFIQESTDEGLTWTPRREITSQVKKSNWRWYATGPCHAIQLTRGAHAGRIVVPANHSTDVSSSASSYGQHLLYSDDAGSNWSIGADASPNNGIINPNESSCVELTDGRIYASARDQNGSAAGNRAYTYSADAGVTYTAPFAIDSSLVSPVCQASILRFSATDQGDSINRILFSSPGDSVNRVSLTIRSSFNETASWDAGKVLYAGAAAYSDLVKLPSGRAGVLYEKDGYATVTFVSFSATYLGRDTTAALSASANPSLVNSNVVFTVAIQTNGVTAAGATGAVIFRDGVTALSTNTLVNGVATCTNRTLSPGPHVIWADYSGDNTYGGSTSALLSQNVVGSFLATTTLLSASPSPAAVGGNLTLTATVRTNGVKTDSSLGSVVFKDSANVLGSVPLSGGVAALTTSSLRLGSHVLKAEYSGSGAFLTSTSAPVALQVQSPITTTTALSSSFNPSVEGSLVSLTATVQVAGTRATAAAGSMVFKDNAVPFSTNAVSAGLTTFSTSMLPAGSHSLVAEYGGYGPYLSSASPVVAQGVQRVPTTPANLLWSAGDGLLTLSWPGYLGWVLQFQTNSLALGLGANWSDLPGTDRITQTNVPFDAAQKGFYRLRRP